MKVVTAPVGVELAEQPVPLDHLGDAAKTRLRPFLLDQNGRVDRAGRIVEGNHEIERWLARQPPPVPRAVLVQHHPHHRPPRPLLAMRRALRRRLHQPGPLQGQPGHRAAELVIVPLHHLLVKMLHREVGIARPRKAPACARSPRPPPDGSTACRSADRANRPILHRAAGRATAETSAPQSPASRPPRSGSARPAHADRATPQTASPAPLAAPPPDPSTAPLSSGSKTGQISRYKFRTDHPSATRGPGELAPACPPS